MNAEPRTARAARAPPRVKSVDGGVEMAQEDAQQGRNTFDGGFAADGAEFRKSAWKRPGQFVAHQIFQHKKVMEHLPDRFIAGHQLCSAEVAALGTQSRSFRVPNSRLANHGFDPDAARARRQWRETMSDIKPVKWNSVDVERGLRFIVPSQKCTRRSFWQIETEPPAIPEFSIVMGTRDRSEPCLLCFGKRKGIGPGLGRRDGLHPRERAPQPGAQPSQCLGQACRHELQESIGGEVQHWLHANLNGKICTLICHSGFPQGSPGGCRESGGEMPAGSGADDNNFVGIEAVDFCAGSDQTQSAGGVFDHGGVTMSCGAQTVVEHVGLEALQLEDPGKSLAFLCGKRSIAAPSKNQHGTSRECRTEGFINIQHDCGVGRVGFGVDGQGFHQ